MLYIGVWTIPVWGSPAQVYSFVRTAQYQCRWLLCYTVSDIIVTKRNVTKKKTPTTVTVNSVYNFYITLSSRLIYCYVTRERTETSHSSRAFISYASDSPPWTRLRTNSSNTNSSSSSSGAGSVLEYEKYDTQRLILRFFIQQYYTTA